jgi:hypothetical protein
MKFIVALTVSMLSLAGVASAGKAPGPTAFPDPPSPKDGQYKNFNC